jgi:hypothetical protein
MQIATFSTRHQLKEAVLNGLFPESPPFFPRYHIDLVRSCGIRCEVLGLVVAYSGEASSDVHRVADLVATRLASKHLAYVKTSKSIAKEKQTQRICRAWGHSFARGFARVVLDRMWDNLDQAPGSRNWGSELDADDEFNFFYPLTAGRGRS